MCHTTRRLDDLRTPGRDGQNVGERGGWRSIGMLTARQVGELAQVVLDLESAVASGKVRFVPKDDRA